MTTMTWGNSEGTKGRCDAECHMAKCQDCRCLCGGRYHGKGEGDGLREAMEQYEAEIVESANKRAAAEGLTVKFKPIVEVFGQGELFTQRAEGGRTDGHRHPARV
jgi:hypothetical protein